MSSLLGLKTPIPERVVQVSDSEGFPVRGLTPLQVFALYKRHTGQLGELFDRVMASVRDTGEAQPADIETIVLTLIQEAPVLLGELIVVGSGGSPESIDDFEAAYDIAVNLPFPVQADALAKIADLTFTSDMPPGKFVALIGNLAQRAVGVLTTISPPTSENGSGESAEP